VGVAANLLAQAPEVLDKMGRVTDAAERVADLQEQQRALAREQAALEAEANDKMRAILQEGEELEQSARDKLAAVTLERAELRVRIAEMEVEAAAALGSSVRDEASRDAEKLESVKTAGLGGLSGAVASLPLLLATTDGGAETVAGVLAAGASGVLFGVVWRYAVRTDLSNVQLKSGVVAAFALVRALGLTADEGPRVLGGDVVALANAGVLGAESMWLFFFTALVLEQAVGMGAIKLYGEAAEAAEAGEERM
jgi:hypothetical protein